MMSVDRLREGRELVGMGEEFAADTPALIESECGVQNECQAEHERPRNVLTSADLRQVSAESICLGRPEVGRVASDCVWPAREGSGSGLPTSRCLPPAEMQVDRAG